MHTVHIILDGKPTRAFEPTGNPNVLNARALPVRLDRCARCQEKLRVEIYSIILFTIKALIRFRLRYIAPAEPIQLYSYNTFFPIY